MSQSRCITRLYMLLLSTTACIVISSCGDKTEDHPLPNIILFLVDDMGVMDTSVPFLTDEEGQPKRYPLNDFYRTPNIEELAKSGVRFSHFYAHSVCSPTRASIMTGQNAARHGTTNWIRSERNNKNAYGPSQWNWQGLGSNSITLPRLLQSANYTTIYIGKAHLGPFDSPGADPLNLGFDINIAGSSIGEPGSYYGTDGYGHIGGNEKRAVPDLEQYHGKEVFLTEALTREAMSAVSQAAKADRPFFLQLSHYAVHTPFQSDPRFADNYALSSKSKKEQAYATLIEGIDKSLGDIVDHVRALGLGPNTLLLFLGDNGGDAPTPVDRGYGSSIPLRGKKGNHWEGGMRVPFLASWVTPDTLAKNQIHTPISANTIQTQMGTILDLLPTLCHLAQVPLPYDQPLDGYDLHEQLAGRHNDLRDEDFLNHFPHEHRSSYFTSFKKGDTKVIYHYPTEGPLAYELYDLSKDPFESTNLADTEPDLLTYMIESMVKEMTKMNAQLPEKDGQKIEVSVASN